MEKAKEPGKNEKEALLREVQRLLDSGIYGAVTRTKTIAVIGNGGAGGNILQRLHKMGIKSMKNIETIAINSDERVLDLLKDVDKRVVIGKNLYEHPEGAHGRTDLARKMIDAARESLEVLVKPYPVLVLIGALGGGTGSELMVEMSRMGVQKGKLVIAMPIMPFSAETGRRALAKRVMQRLESTGAIIAPLDNDMLIKDERIGKLSLAEAFETLDRIIFRKIREVQDESMKTVINEITRDIMERLSTAYEEPDTSGMVPSEMIATSISVEALTAKAGGVLTASAGTETENPAVPEPENGPKMDA